MKGVKEAVLFFLLLYISPTLDQPYLEDILSRWRRSFEKVSTYKYRCFYHSEFDGKVEERTYRYYFKKPKLIRMEITSGKDKGSVAVYRDGKVRAHRGGILSFIVLTFDVKDKMVCDKRGNGMDTTDWGYIIEEMERALRDGKLKAWKGNLEGKDVYIMEADLGGRSDRIYLSAKELIPLRREGVEGKKVVSYEIYRDIEINVPLDEDLFKL